MRWTVGGYTTLCLAGLACGDLSGPEVGEPEVFGTPITSTGDVVTSGRLVWTADGTEIIYIVGFRSPTTPSIRAVNLETGATRTIRSTCLRDSFVGLAVGGIVYARDEDRGGTCDTGNRRLHFVSTDGAVDTLLADSVHSYHASFNGRFLAFITPRWDSVHVIDLELRIRAAFGTSPGLDYDGQFGSWADASLSPTGRELAYRLEGRVVFRNLQDGSVRERPLPGEFIQWDEAGYWVGTLRSGFVSVWNVETGLSGGGGRIRGEGGWYGEATLSPDRGALAFWNSWCSKSSQPSPISPGVVCHEETYALQHVKLASGSVTRLALARARSSEAFNRGESYAGTSFSPDGQRVAYVIERDIYVSGAGQ